jgi:hypothetical protein
MSHASEFDATTNRPNFFLSSEVVAAAEDEARKRGTVNTDDAIDHKKARKTESETVPSSDPSSFGDSNGRNDLHTEFYDMPASDLMEANSNLRDSHNFASTTQAPHEKGDAPVVASTNDTSSNNNEADPQERPELDAITREAGLILDDKLQGVRDWCKKLLQEITVYVQVTGKTQEEYLGIQRMEHQESDRLDSVEPDVKGATSHLLEPPFFGAAPSLNATVHVGDGKSNQT